MNYTVFIRILKLNVLCSMTGWVWLKISIACKQVQINSEDDGYAHVEVYVDTQRVQHLQGIKTGFTKNASLDPLTVAEEKGSAKRSKKGCAIS